MHAEERETLKHLALYSSLSRMTCDLNLLFGLVRKESGPDTLPQRTFKPKTVLRYRGSTAGNVDLSNRRRVIKKIYMYKS